MVSTPQPEPTPRHAPPFTLSRRHALLAAGATGIGLGLSNPGAALAAPAHPGLAADPAAHGATRIACHAASETTSAMALSLGDAQFIKHGLQLMAWVSTPDSTDGTTPVPRPSAAEFLACGFNAPQYYYEGSEGMYETAFVDRMPGKTWSAAKFPHAWKINAAPDPADEMLTAQMKANREGFFAACFGDEEDYSADRVTWWAQYYAKLRAESPTTLCYNNQYQNQFTDDQMRDYMSRAQPDLLSWDTYYFFTPTDWTSGSVTRLYNGCERYRRLALAGNDGTGAVPLNWGQYTQGFTNNAGTQFFISQSQIAIVSFVSVAMGAKLLNLFRYTWSSDQDVFVLNTVGGATTPQYTDYSRLNVWLAHHGPYLVRLRSHSVGVARGQAAHTGGLNAKSALADFSASLDPDARVTSLSAANVGGGGGGQPGDVLIGTFRAIPGMSDAEAGGFVDRDQVGFMLVNALALPNVDGASRTSTGGTWQETQQRITVGVTVPAGAAAKRLLRVDSQTGALFEVPLTHVSGEQYRFNFTLWGGTGSLFLWRA